VPVADAVGLAVVRIHGAAAAVFDYLFGDAPLPLDDIDARPPATAERCKGRQNNPTVGQGAEYGPTHTPPPQPSHDIERKPQLSRDGPEDDWEL